MERGLAREGSGPASGWVARHLLATEHHDDSPLRADRLRGYHAGFLCEGRNQRRGAHVRERFQA